MLKKILFGAVVAAASLFAGSQADADVRVRGYYRSNGTYVQPHYRSNPDGLLYNNWSTYPNINPYTGRTGTLRAPSYSSGYRSYGRYYSPSSYYYPSRSYYPIRYYWSW